MLYPSSVRLRELNYNRKIIGSCEEEKVMDVELQILKHLKRSPRPTVSVIDKYCESYNDLFSDVRGYECFKYLHQGIISPIKRKSLPEIAKISGVHSSQSLPETRYIREIIYGKRNSRTYWEVTTDPETMPSNSIPFMSLSEMRK